MFKVSWCFKNSRINHSMSFNIIDEAILFYSEICGNLNVETAALNNIKTFIRA